MTYGPIRKQYLTTPLLLEIRDRINEIKSNKEFLGTEYHDCDLLICQPDGKPIGPKSLNKYFKRWQANMKIEDQIVFQGLRKSGQMHKVPNQQFGIVAVHCAKSASFRSFSHWDFASLLPAFAGTRLRPHYQPLLIMKAGRIYLPSPNKKAPLQALFLVGADEQIRTAYPAHSSK